MPVAVRAGSSRGGRLGNALERGLSEESGAGTRKDLALRMEEGGGTSEDEEGGRGSNGGGAGSVRLAREEAVGGGRSGGEESAKARGMEGKLRGGVVRGMLVGRDCDRS